MTSSPSPALTWIIPAVSIVLFFCSGHLLAFISGWHRLAMRFRMEGEFTGRKWKMQSARLRFTRYGNVLTIGANQTGLFLAPFVLFSMGHPPLFIPWTEISNARPVTILFFKFVAMHLGQEEQIPFTIGENLANQLKALAGTAWPVGNRNWQPPPPIG